MNTVLGEAPYLTDTSQDLRVSALRLAIIAPWRNVPDGDNIIERAKKFENYINGTESRST